MRLLSYIFIFTSTLVVSSFTIKQEKKSIIFFGDSLTAGMGLSKEQAFPAIVQKTFINQGTPVEVINSGLSGETSAGGVSRIDWILRKPVDIFVLELGANDALRGLPIGQTKSNLQAIINKVKKKYPSTKIVLAGMMAPPNLGSEYTSAFMKIYPELAQKNNLALIPFLLKDVAGYEKLNLPDGIHPNIEGHKIVAKNVLEVLKEMI